MPSGLRIELKGLDNAIKQMERIEKGAANLGDYRATIGSKLPYAYGQEYGTHLKSRKLARASGGTFYLRRAVDEVTSGMDKDISEGLEKVTTPGPWILRRLAGWARRLARQNAPRSHGIKGKNKKHNYRLYRSITYSVRKKK